MTEIIDTARNDAAALAEAGFPALMVENFGDIPFYASSVPPETIAAMTIAAQAVADESGLVLGVNVLRNDAQAALAVAVAVGAEFIRVNVLTGVMYTDQGMITGDAAALLRNRQRLSPTIDIWADVMVKHAVAPPGLTIAQAARDTAERGLADVIIVSGSGTGSTPSLDDARTVKKEIPGAVPVAIGSGTTAGNLSMMLDVADAIIVGSSLKHDGDARNRVDPKRAREMVAAAREHGLI
jgi:membrane complex biogenesis BtpA family protein